MTAEKAPVLIDLTEVFRRYADIPLPGQEKRRRPKTSYEHVSNGTRGVTVNASEFLKLSDYTPRSGEKDFNVVPGTTIETTAKTHIVVQETRAEISQKVKAAMAP